jgi:hypothetical protein
MQSPTLVITLLAVELGTFSDTWQIYLTLLFLRPIMSKCLPFSKRIPNIANMEQARTLFNGNFGGREPSCGIWARSHPILNCENLHNERSLEVLAQLSSPWCMYSRSCHV